MRDPIGKKAAELKPSGIRKFFDIVAEMDDVISLGVGEPDFDTPWAIRDEGIYSLERGRTFYTSNSGLKELRTEIAAYIRRRLGVNYNPVSEILVTVGGSEGIDLAFRAMINPGDEVLIPEPSYVSYKPCAILADAVPVVIPLKEKNQFRLTAEEVEAAVTPKTKILVLPFPNNPTGAVMTRADLEAVAKVCIEHDLYVLSDEIYSELTYNGEDHVSIACIDGMKERTIVCNSLSKTYSVTGWRLGYVIAPPKIAERVKKVHDFLTVGAAAPLMEAAVVGLEFKDDYYESLQKHYTHMRNLFIGGLKNIGLTFTEPQGAYYVLLDISEFGYEDDNVFCEQMIQKVGVAAVPGSSFFREDVNHLIRFHFAKQDATLLEALDRLADIKKKMRK